MWRVVLSALVALIVQSGFAQEYSWSQWDQRYQEVNPVEILEEEERYADSIRSHHPAQRSYSRIDQYRFRAIFLGQRRPVSGETRLSMKLAFSLRGGNPEAMDELKTELLFQIDEKEIWMPVQEILLGPLEAEIDANASVYLYCLFLNEHNFENQLYNIFLVSEFRALR